MLLGRGLNVTVLGDDNSYINKYLNDKNLIFNKFKISEDSKYYSSDNDFFILSLSYIVLARKYIEFNANSQLFFWDLHPYALIETLSFSKFYKIKTPKFVIDLLKFVECSYIKKMRNIIQIGHEKGGIHFMCYQNFLTNKDFFALDFSPDFLPIPIKIFKPFDYIKNKNHLCWISRLDKDKTSVLKILIDDVIQYNNNNEDKLILHIVGDGNSVENVKKIASGYSIFFLFPGILNGDKLSEYMISNQIRIGFAMGTSALEFASRGIATVLVPGTTEKDFFFDKTSRYLWIYDSYNYDVAVARFHFSGGRLCSFDDIIKSTDNNNSKLSYEYVLNTHSESVIFKKLMGKIEKNELKFSDLEKSGIFDLNILHKLKIMYKGIFKK